VRCASGATAPVSAVVPSVLAPVLRSARAELPHGEWRTRVSRALAMATGMGTPIYRGEPPQPGTPEATLVQGLASIHAAQHALAAFLQRALDEDAASTVSPFDSL
jgi:hypothetical protein